MQDLKNIFSLPFNVYRAVYLTQNEKGQWYIGRSDGPCLIHNGGTVRWNTSEGSHRRSRPPERGPSLIHESGAYEWQSEFPNGLWVHVFSNGRRRIYIGKLKEWKMV